MIVKHIFIPPNLNLSSLSRKGYLGHYRYLAANKANDDHVKTLLAALKAKNTQVNALISKLTVDGCGDGDGKKKDTQNFEWASNGETHHGMPTGATPRRPFGNGANC